MIQFQCLLIAYAKDVGFCLYYLIGQEPCHSINTQITSTPEYQARTISQDQKQLTGILLALVLMLV